MHFLRFLREHWGEFQKWHLCERGRKYQSIFTDFTSIYHIRAQCDEERLNDDQSEQEVELSNTRTASVIDIPNTLSLTRNDRKQKFQ